MKRFAEQYPRRPVRSNRCGDYIIIGAWKKGFGRVVWEKSEALGQWSYELERGEYILAQSMRSLPNYDVGNPRHREYEKTWQILLGSPSRVSERSIYEHTMPDDEIGEEMGIPRNIMMFVKGCFLGGSIREYVS